MPRELRAFCPLGLLTVSLAFDFAFLATGFLDFGIASYWMLSAGILIALLSLILTPLTRLGLWRGAGKVLVTSFFIWSWFLRDETHEPGGDAIMLSVLGVTLAVVSGWLCGELAFRQRIRVGQRAHLH